MGNVREALNTSTKMTLFSLTEGIKEDWIKQLSHCVLLFNTGLANHFKSFLIPLMMLASHLGKHSIKSPEFKN